MINYQVEEKYYIAGESAFEAMSWVLENCGYQEDAKVMVFNTDKHFQPMPWSGRFICAEFHKASERWVIEVCKQEH